ncbi:hypothetical protein PFAG_05141 [Plasmodium falciparum Santa Lucia]|uniref:Uncharacterized protein n=6 Tax=Plasmodium falciparum TaxID=5833 RepID=W4IUM7_PLAFP|nr:hypothetical protein PFFVO_04694 [Plasmodium falciparum Vietnam Oak-Knoll (FVO)]ETW40444.1 hypothetical protein PFNF135_05271 [Plasmodium falciparum NF135/5.C10]ETW46938.1 hypothetical protein PFMALIP_04928 [Plasmodium falciparum MaliPS096_E11]ETW53708.1 hypothetical protein PFUGPA_03582 [Plasmodium falciparum Palo Alto/Uganda]EUR64867.1 hypothetical protein PFBG_05105 [Plasmodium falciparum 7G8]EUT78565.1 hypothetical protein PFAG_05141 [Plasmodium falciparum Santa Lucia]
MNIFKRIKYFLLGLLSSHIHLYISYMSGTNIAYLFSFKPSIKYYAKKNIFMDPLYNFLFLFFK